MNEYQYDPADCDVAAERREALMLFRERRILWFRWLIEDQHAIHPAITSMVWNEASFEIWARATELLPTSALSNPLIEELIVRGYFARQASAIRRLSDRRADVISVPRMIGDLRKHIDLLSRENFVCFDGLPYDFETAKERAHDRHAGQGFRWAEKSGPNAWSASADAHQCFDRLCGVKPDNRSRLDSVPACYFDAIEGEWKASDAYDIVKWAHKFEAHAADERSRGSIDIAAVEPTLGKINDVIHVLVEVSERLHALLALSQGNVLPIPTFDQYALLGGGAFSAVQIDQLRSAWDELADRYDNYVKKAKDRL